MSEKIEWQPGDSGFTLRDRIIREVQVVESKKKTLITVWDFYNGLFSIHHHRLFKTAKECRDAIEVVPLP